MAAEWTVCLRLADHVTLPVTGLPSTTVQLIVWTDALMSAETGTRPFFSDVPKQIAIQSYTPQEAVHVTNFSSPNRTQHPGYDKEPLERDSEQPTEVIPR